jgi:hypothetical protein
MFRTELTLKPSEAKISYETPVLSAGSCFAVVMGQRMIENKLKVSSNPFGVIFNPVSLFRLLNYSLERKFPEISSYVEGLDQFYNLELHSDFASPKLEQLVFEVEEAIVHTGEFLKETKWLIITLGTAWVYQKVDTGLLVANCHKLPSHLFHKKLLSVEEIVSSFSKTYKNIKAKHPDINFIITVSPVRHIKDTLELNSVSKSVLRLAADQLETAFDDVDYFPSYEIMTDDLRDYRFYKKDMIHPTEVAEDYIWGKFTHKYFSEEALQMMQEWQQLKKAVHHRPFNPATEAHQTFIRKTIEKLEKLNSKIDVLVEIQHLKNQLL